MSDNISELKNKASNPNTPGLELQQLATNAELRPLIAKNPAAYTGLLDWLAGKNEPEVMAALQERQQMFAAGMAMPMPSVALPADLLVNSDSSNVAGAEHSPDTSTDASPIFAAEPLESLPDATGDTPQTNPTDSTETAEAAANTTALPPTRTSILGNNNPEETTVLSGTAVTSANSAADSAATPAAAADAPSGTAPATTPAASALPPSYAPGSGPSTPTPFTPATAASPVAPPATPPALDQTSVIAPAGFNNPNAAYNQEFEEEEPKSNTILWIIFGFLLIVVIALAVALIMAFLGSRDDSTSETPSQNPGDETSQTTDPKANSQDPSAKPSETAKEPMAPAPAGAIETPALTTLSGNTSCAVSGDMLTCMLKDHEATIESCGPETSVKVTLTDGAPQVSCQPKEAYAPSGGAVQYDQSITTGDFACTSTHDYTECWNTMTGEAFQLARQGYQSFQK